MTIPASAASYFVEGAEGGLFDVPSSAAVSLPAADNTDKSKNAAYIPPAFGSGESYLPNRGDVLSGGVGHGTGVPSPGGSVVNPPSQDLQPGGTAPGYRFTAVTSSAYYANGSLGTLSIPSLGVSCKIYEGTGDNALAKGAGHFTNTSIWEGNVALAGHNRGTSAVFGRIHTLDTGASIRLTTPHGTRTYSVYSVAKVLETDTTCLAQSYDNIITLVTCVANQPAYRYVVQARQVN